jgi:CxxC motif-containing protein (DUF1111 family)
LFFLHEGRTSDLLQAIQAHSSVKTECEDRSETPCYSPSEANTVIGRFNALPAVDRQAILDFLRSL